MSIKQTPIKQLEKDTKLLYISLVVRRAFHSITHFKSRLDVLLR